MKTFSPENVKPGDVIKIQALTDVRWVRVDHYAARSNGQVAVNCRGNYGDVFEVGFDRVLEKADDIISLY